MKVVGIGASAGGVDALKRFLTHLPPDTGAAYVIIQHLSPDFKSIMDDLLGKHTQMPIKIVHEDEVVQADHVYLMPGNKVLTFQYGMLQVENRKENEKLNLPIDRFFHSLGEDLGEKAIGIILSGSGTDGSRGARTIKEAGGIILAQTAESAKFDGMPSAIIQLGIADATLSPEELAGRLAGILKSDQLYRDSQKNEDQPEESELEWFEEILRYTANSSGIAFSNYKRATLLRRTAKRMALHQIKDFENYYKFLTSDAKEGKALYRDFLINVTQFFRDTGFFDALVEEVIPKILEAASETQLIRIWVPACSTGEEAYSIAIVLNEYMEESKDVRDFKIFASDVSQESIAIASRGEYNSSIIADVPAKYLEKYFIAQGENYQVVKAIQEKIIFAIQNVIHDPPFIHMNLISCRNLLIYLRTTSQTELLKTFYFALEKDSYLALGPSESLGDLNSVFETVNRSWNIFRRKNVDYKAVRKVNTFDPNKVMAKERYNFKFILPKLPEMDKLDEGLQDPFSLYLIDNFAPKTIFLNEKLDVLYLSGELDQLLSLPKAVAKLNLGKMLPQYSLWIFRDGVRSALDDENIIELKNINIQKGDRSIKCNLSFQKVKLFENMERIVMVNIKIISGQEPKDEAKRGIKSIDLDPETYTNEKISRLEKAIHNKNRELDQMARDREMVHEELYSSNRELMASNQELQSTNEELQSVNEELHTVNTELQHKNGELVTAHNDILNLLRSTEIETIFLDEKLRIRKFSPAAQRQFELIPTDIDRPITAFATNLKNVDIETICRRVYESLTPFEDEVQDQKNNYFHLRVLPYRTRDHQVKGVVITLTNINDVKVAIDQARDMGKMFTEMLKVTEFSVMFLTPAGKITYANRPFGQYAKKQLKDKSIYNLLPENKGQALKKAVDKTIKNGKNSKFQLEFFGGKDQIEFAYELHILPLFQENKIKSITIAAVENTEHINYRRALEEVKEAYTSFMENAQHQMLLIDKNGIIININRTRYIDKTTDEIIGTSVYSYLVKEEAEQYKKSIDQIFAGESKSKISINYVSPKGEEIPMTLIATPVIVGKKVAYVALVANPTE